MSGASQPALPLEYGDLHIVFAQVGAGEYAVSMRSEWTGERMGSLRLPFDRATLSDRLRVIVAGFARTQRPGGTMLADAPAAMARDLGSALFNALFDREMRSGYDLALGLAKQIGKGLRLRLHLTPDLTAIPWELLYDERPEKRNYLCLSRQTPLVRYPDVGQPIGPLPVAGKLRVLGMIAQPRDLARLDTRAEKEWIDQALQPLQQADQLELTWLPGATWRDLQVGMQQGPWHVFHFIGHGDFDPVTQEGRIALVDETTGGADPLTVTEMRSFLDDQPSLRLVVLNSCQGAKSSEGDAFASVATGLIAGGLPAAVGMQFAVSDKAAIAFARAFYASLAVPYAVDAALAEARKAMRAARRTSVEWCSPVLFMRSPDGVLFRRSPATPRSHDPPTETGDQRQAVAAQAVSPAFPQPVVENRLTGRLLPALQLDDLMARRQLLAQQLAAAMEQRRETLDESVKPVLASRIANLQRQLEIVEQQLAQLSL